MSALAGPQERFDAIRAHHHRRTGGRLVDLAYPNPGEVHPQLVEALVETLRDVDGGGLQYTPYGGATIPRRHVAHGLRRSHGVKVAVDDVVLTPGAMSALTLTFAAALEDGGEVVIVSPCWLDTPLYVATQGGTPVLVPTRADGHLDLAALGAALSPRTRAVVLSQPANPTGVLYGERELQALAELLSRHPSRPLLVSDECHRDFVFDAPFVSPLSFYPRAAVVYSFGKRLLAQGQRLGYVAFHPSLEGWPGKVRGLARAMGHATPTALMQRAVPRLMQIPTDASALATRRRHAVDRLDALGLSPIGRHTMFVYGRVPEPWDDFAFCELAASRGVLVMPSSLFHAAGGFRIAVTATDEALDAGLDALESIRAREAA